METKDTRMKKTNEILSGIKYVKMCGAENKFLESVRFFMHKLYIGNNN